jgi:hypothetical protein
MAGLYDRIESAAPFGWEALRRFVATAYEAEVVHGVEDAADHPERPVHSHQDQSRSSNIPKVAVPE